MIRALVIIILGVAAVIIGLSLYLQPNDLSKCDPTPSIVAPCAAVDAIVAVSGGDTNARTDQAISLYKHGWSSYLIFSGAAQDKTGPSNAAAMRVRAVAAGVPSSHIYLDEGSETTKENAVNVETIFTEHNIKSVILVTSGYHQRRASLEFHKVSTGISVYNDPVLTDDDWSFWWWVTPRGWWLAIGEFVKISIFEVSVI